ncbi:MAG TPA: hypothetical protein VGJ58_09200 [Gaiellaceae bacterium]
MLTVDVTLAAAAFLAGLTGTWSPCGFSSIETIGTMPARRRAVVATCLTFAAGALLGGAAMFGSLALAGAVLPGTGTVVAVGAAAFVVVIAAVAELRSVRIAPQIRRQVPEPWRRSMPLTLAAALYGVLLGFGFATFVLTFAVWALAAVVLAVGDPAVGVVVGLAFGAGRALPVAAIAPLLTRRLGQRLAESMAERPVLLRGFRFADGIALLCCAVALAGAEASAATKVARPASDPTVAAGLFAWQGRFAGMLREPGQAPAAGAAHHLSGLTRILPGTDPALGGSLLAWREGRQIRVVRSKSFAFVARFVVPDANALAVSDRWVVYRGRAFNGGDRIAARPLTAPTPTRERTIASTNPPAELGRPALDGNRLVFHVAGVRKSQIVEVDLRRGTRRVLRSSRLDQLTNPAVLGRRLLYVRQSNTRQLLELGSLLSGPDRVMYAAASTSVRDAGHEEGYSPITRTPPPTRPAPDMFWTTALSPGYTYLTLLPVRGAAKPTILRLRR